MKLLALRLTAAVALLAVLQAHTFAADLRAVFEKLDHKGIESGLRLAYEQGLTQLIDAFMQAADHNYGPLVGLVRPLADQGHTSSQYLLADIYRDANNFIQAVKWYRPAALKGHTKAQFRLGALYYHGVGVLPAKPIEGLAWISVAAAQGHNEAGKHKGILEIISPFTAAEKQRLDQLTRQYWNDYVLPFHTTD